MWHDMQHWSCHIWGQIKWSPIRAKKEARLLINILPSCEGNKQQQQQQQQNNTKTITILDEATSSTIVVVTICNTRSNYCKLDPNGREREGGVALPTKSTTLSAVFVCILSFFYHVDNFSSATATTTPMRVLVTPNQ